MQKDKTARGGCGLQLAATERGMETTKQEQMQAHHDDGTPGEVAEPAAEKNTETGEAEDEYDDEEANFRDAGGPENNLAEKYMTARCDADTLPRRRTGGRCVHKFPERLPQLTVPVAATMRRKPFNNGGGQQKVVEEEGKAEFENVVL